MRQFNISGLIFIFLILFALVWLIRALWPLIVIFILYVLIKSVFTKDNQPTYRPNFDQMHEQPRQRTNREVQGDVIDADFEAREVD